MKSIFILTSLALTTSAFAHPGPRIWVGNENGTLMTYQQSSSNFVHEQVFSQALENIVDNIWTTDFPGYEVRTGGNVPSGTTIGIGFTGPLLKFTGTGIGFVELESPGETKLAITNEQDETVMSSTGVAPGFDFFFPSVAGDHSHLFYTPYGNGTDPGGASDGVYIQPLRLTSPTLVDSDWYFLVLSQNGSASDQTNAVVLAHTMASATPGDANFDGVVDFNDLLTVAQNYGTTNGSWWTTGDFDFDGAVNFSDVLNVAQNYASAAGRDFESDWNLAQSFVPEPGTLFAFGIVALMIRRT